MRRRARLLSFIVGLCALGAQADDLSEIWNIFDLADLKNRCGLDFVSLTASADLRSASLSRAKVCEARPMSSQLLSGDIHLYPIHVPGRVGIDFWTISSLTHKMDTIHKNMFFQERDFTLRYGYDWDITEGWRLASDAMSTWVNLPGYRHDLGLDYCRHE